MIPYKVLKQFDLLVEIRILNGLRKTTLQRIRPVFILRAEGSRFYLEQSMLKPSNTTGRREERVDDASGTSRYRNPVIAVAALVAAIAIGAFFYNSGDPVSPPTESATPAALAVPDYRLTPTGTVVRANGEVVPVAAPVTGYVDGVKMEGSTAFIGGWAVDFTRRQPAALIVVFVDGVLVGSGSPSMARPDVRAVLKADWAGKSGYVVAAPISSGRPPRDITVRVFALNADSQAKQLIYPVNYPFKRD